MVNPQLKELMKELGDAINSSVSESEAIARIIARLKDEGYEIYMALQATIGFNRKRTERRPRAGHALCGSSRRLPGDLRTAICRERQ